MLTLRSPEQKYNAQSKSVVNADGSFSGELFSNTKNPQRRIHKGIYLLEIVVPIVSVQPEDVKLAFGEKGRNLADPYVNEDTILGKTVRYEKEFVV